MQSYLDSTGVKFRNGNFDPPTLYKLFTEKRLRDVVLGRLRKDLIGDQLCPRGISVTLCLAAGKIATQTDTQALQAHFDRQGWRLFTPEWVVNHLRQTAEAAYEDDVALMVAKLLKRTRHVISNVY